MQASQTPLGKLYSALNPRRSETRDLLELRARDAKSPLRVQERSDGCCVSQARREAQIVFANDRLYSELVSTIRQVLPSITVEDLNKHAAEIFKRMCGDGTRPVYVETPSLLEREVLQLKETRALHAIMSPRSAAVIPGTGSATPQQGSSRPGGDPEPGTTVIHAATSEAAVFAHRAARAAAAPVKGEEAPSNANVERETKATLHTGSPGQRREARKTELFAQWRSGKFSDEALLKKYSAAEAAHFVGKLQELLSFAAMHRPEFFESEKAQRPLSSAADLLFKSPATMPADLALYKVTNMGRDSDQRLFAALSSPAKDYLASAHAS